MKAKQGIAGVVGLALLGILSTNGWAAEGAARTMADVTARLTVASEHAATLVEAFDRQAPLPSVPSEGAASATPGGHEIALGPDGGGYPAEGTVAMPTRPARKITGEMASALDGIESAVREARTLAAGHEYLEPGIEHVLTNAQRIRANAKQSADAASLSHEIAIELLALANNARVLEAEADLRAASAIRGKDRTGAFKGHLEAAVDVLTDAQDKGAYHMEDDIAALRVVLARLKGGGPAGEAVTADAMDELIADVHEHLADLRGD